MKIVVAPDSFKGSATAREVAEAIARGWRSRRDDELVLLPLADGGEGTLAAFESSVAGSIRHRVTVTGPDGAPVDASWLMLPDGTAVVELATTSGITLLSEGGLLPLDATGRGFGEAIADALAAGASRLLLAVGSSCSTDGGAGALQALGARLDDAYGNPIRPGARGLADLASVDLTAMLAVPTRGAIVVSDVANPLLGPNGAAAVFGPQKGATADDVEAMDAGLAHYAGLLPASAETAGAGAAGGTSFGLLAWGATLEPGAGVVADAVGLEAALDGADLIITGEGRYDAQSAQGKLPSHVAGLAHARGVPVALVAGSIDARTDEFVAAVALAELEGSVEAAIAHGEAALERAGAALAAGFDGAA